MLKQIRKHFLTIAFSLGALCTSLPMAAQAEPLSNLTPSEQISIGTLSIVASPAASVQDGSTGPVGTSLVGLTGSYLIVEGSVLAGKDIVEYTMEGIKNGARISVQVPKTIMEKTGASVGTTVELVSHTTGAILVVSGKVLAFIPNTIGEALLHQEKITTPAAAQKAY